MSDTELTLVLSGHLCRPQSVDMRPFWRGFIELQRKLPATRRLGHVVVHSWNPEMAGLVQLVYAPHAEHHEQQPTFYSEFMHRIEPPDQFERGLNRLNSTWKNVSLQSVLGNARSRARAVQLMDALPVSEGQVLITRWDLGQTGSLQVNQLVADAALPKEYMYLSYFSEVDEGYADMWVLAEWGLARRFGEFDTFVLESLTGGNAFLEQFCESGWPRARVKTRYEASITHPIGQRIHTHASRLVGFVRALTPGGSIPERTIRRLIGPMQRFLEQPHLTAENSCVPSAADMPRTFPTFMSLNIHALLKYFILSEGLRERTRFVTHEDFEIAAQSGQVINPQPFVLLLWDAGEAGLAPKRLVASSPLPIAAVYHMGESVRAWTPDQSGGWAPRVLQPTSGSSRDRLLCALDAAIEETHESMPVLIMPTADDYLACIDWCYLNALLKYIAWRRLDYVGLGGSQSGKSSLEFPGLNIARGSGAFSLRLAAGTTSGIRSFLNVADSELRDICDRADRMLLEFPVVADSGALF
ncbi:hypothetical protein MOLA814_00690 [Betaproteobacteria bacterium MOLA814]|nr:hypothetical protein MOLA814_00690 [Betaproteobacteria bacterium MOLA814]